MDQHNGTLSDSLSRLTRESAPLKRKFAPNLSKALAKKTVADSPKSGPKPKKLKDEAGDDGNESSKKGHRKRINRRALEDDEPRFVQSYSIFEKGIGCVVKADSNATELRAIGSGPSRTSVSELASTELKPDPVFQAESFVKDIKQCFKDAPVAVLQDTSDLLPLLVSAEPSRRCAQVPTQLFDETSATGSLFTLQLPESLLAEDSPILKEGRFGKIQILSNGESRLVVSDSTFRLLCPKPTECSSDVLVVEEQDDGIVNLTSLGHLDQFVSAVPDLERFSRLGR